MLVCPSTHTAIMAIVSSCCHDMPAAKSLAQYVVGERKLELTSTDPSHQAGLMKGLIKGSTAREGLQSETIGWIVPKPQPKTAMLS